MNTLLYYLIFTFWFAFSLLPLCVLYFFSDLLYFPLYYCIRYRRKVVRQNLVSSFPEKSMKEIVKIEKKFYSYFCDYLVETIKLFTISEKQMRRRMKFEGVEEVKASFDEGRPCSLYLGHYCNWEWITSLPLHFDEDVVSGQIYHVLENKVFNDLFLRARSRFRAVNIPMAETLRKIVSYRRDGRKMIIGFISDQAPFWNNIHYWTDFLNHDTPVLTGAERIARQVGFAVYYADITRVKRGYYVCRLKKLSDDPRKLEEFQLTEIYFRELEKTIQRDPQYWLWTHKRWKRTREEFNQRYDEESKRVRLV